MSERGADPSAKDQLFEEAAAWFARMRGPSAEASRADFETWLSRSAAQRGAYNHAAEVFAMGKLLGTDEPPQIRDAERSSTRGKRAVLASAAALLAAGAAALVALYGNEAPGARARAVQIARLETGPSERRSVRLADGSILGLDAGTHLEAHFDSAVRRLTLVEGKARFQVAHHPRPFVVNAGGGTVTARGTIFDVAVLAGRTVSVRLFEGMVDVRLPKAPTDRQHAPVRRLHPGQTIRFVAPDDIEVAARTDLARAHAASDFDEVRLGDLVMRANADALRPLRLADPRLAELRISGRFRAEDPDRLAERSALLFDLEIDRSDPAVLVLRRK